MFFLDRYFFNDDNVIDGVNAMSISDISGIPRATVIRKLNILIEKKYLVINDKKHYTLANETHKEVSEIQRLNFKNLANFTAQVFNLILVEERTSKKIHERLTIEL